MRRHFGANGLFVLLVLALLICDTAAGLASRLAGSLALAATAVLCAFAQVLGIQSLDCHIDNPPNFRILLIIARKTA